MLNERQKRIIKDLESSSGLITAKELSLKYDVSLRTIRNDISAIAEYLEDRDAQFIRIPGGGMRIQAKEKIFTDFTRCIYCREFPYLDNDKRMALLCMKFIFLPNPISTGQLCEDFDVSKATIVNTIRYTNDYLSNRSIAIIRYHNKGYHLQGRPKAILRFVESSLSIEAEQQVYNTLVYPQNGFITRADLDKVNDTLSFISANLFLYISRHHYLLCMLYALICVLRSKGNSYYQYEQPDSKLTMLCHYLEDNFDVSFSKESYQYLKHILSASTDYSENTTETDMDVRLSEAVDAMIDYVSRSGLYQINDVENLKIDLMIHMKSTIDAIHSGMPRENPLLNQIRTTYPQEFDLVKSSVSCFSDLYPLELDDHEVGYLTLYFLRSFDKTEKLQDTKVMVVCNTGRSASKLLATRLINNIPEIHIVSMNSIYSISNNPELFKNVDFVISTVPLPEQITKPSIVISPLLQKNEIDKVKEAIWLSRSSIHTTTPVDNIASDMVEYYDAYKTAGILNKPAQTAEIKNALPYEATLLLGESAMNLFELIGRLYPEDISIDLYTNISGIFAHVLMSLPRWQRSDFIEAYDASDLTEAYPQQYQYIKEYLEAQSALMDITIPETEAVAILRYYIY